MPQRFESFVAATCIPPQMALLKRPDNVWALIGTGLDEMRKALLSVWLSHLTTC